MGMQKLHQLEDKRGSRDRKGNPTDTRQEKVEGLAATFTTVEVKNLFFSYLTTMLVVEGLIFFFSFINHLATEGSIFPWKPYLFATFITPIAITFVFGLILLTFNRLFYGRTSDGFEGQPSAGIGVWRKGERISTFLDVIHRLPLLLSMLLLIAATALAYKMEDIVLYAAQAGATTAKYLFFTLVGVMATAALGVAAWMFLSYRLKSRTLSADHQYRMKLMEHFGLVQLEDGTVLDRQGRVVHEQTRLTGRGHAQVEYDQPLKELPVIDDEDDTEVEDK